MVPMVVYEELIVHLLEKHESTDNCIIVQIAAPLGKLRADSPALTF